MRFVLRRNNIADLTRKIGVESAKPVKGPTMKLPRLTAKRRLYLYGVATAVLGVLLFYRLIAPEAVPVWLALAAVILGIGGNATAAVKVAQQRKDGTLTS
jgi:hypothetical protein